MNMFSVAGFTLLICMTILSTTEGRPLRCSCPGTYSGRPILSKAIDDLKTISAGPHCKNVEIIVTMKHSQKKTCLNPNKDWVKSLKEEMDKKSKVNKIQ
ncbi:C-X-C motif chemokine 10 [Misgurnus anguillicaudatus]|uniref:C-X-C motif chemokine 10 n=1 Tax=Misgurnus anguillicaudatus TaxID=75329 RepID=UPI002435DD23|nr:interleukin-8-like [Misgurnus anguillicaudatus]